MDWLKRDRPSLGDPSGNLWCDEFVEACIGMAPPYERLLGALMTIGSVSRTVARRRGR